jgi:4'-phosphopantetheinyl transferase EntD
MDPIPIPEGLLSPTTWGCALWIDGEAPPLWDGESLSPGAVPRRRREFAFGRACARGALRRMGRAEAAIPSLSDRRPQFPPGVVGTLSHSARLAVAVVGSAADHRSLGVDVELDHPLEPSLEPIVACPAERALGVELGLLFSAKEAAFKCWYAAGGGRIAEFHELELSLDPAGTFAVIRQPPPRVPLSGRWRRALGHWWTVCELG